MNLRNYSYTLELQKAAQKNRWNDTITEYSSVSPNIDDMDKTPIQINAFNLNHTLCHLLEFPKTLYYFFVSEEEGQKKGKQGFSISIYCFQKSTGEYKYIVLQDLKGTPSCITSGFLAQAKENDNRQKKQKIQHSYTITILVGLKQGFIKTIRLSRSNVEGFQTSVDSTKIQQKSIVSIIAADKIYYNQKNICFILLQDSKVFIYNYLIKQTIAIYQPPILSHDFAISMTLHPSGNYIATCTKSGQIFFWELTQKTLELIKTSEQRQFDKKTAKNSNTMYDQNGQIGWKFKTKDRDISVFPMYALHSASINGLKWIGFYGNLLATVSRTGLFRLLAINFQIRDEFIILIEYQIERGQSISTVQIFPEAETLVVTKCKQYVALVREGEQKKNEQLIIKFKEKVLKKNDYNSKMNLNSYTPAFQKDTLIESIKFGSQLRIQKIKRVRLTKELSRQSLDFKYTILSKDGCFILAGNQNEFFIGTCSQYFDMDTQ